MFACFIEFEIVFFRAMFLSETCHDLDWNNFNSYFESLVLSVRSPICFLSLISFLRTATANAAQLDAASVARAMHAWMDDLFFHRLPRHALWVDADEDECEGTKEAVEKFIISKLPVKYACARVLVWACVCLRNLFQMHPLRSLPIISSVTTRLHIALSKCAACFTD